MRADRQRLVIGAQIDAALAAVGERQAARRRPGRQQQLVIRGLPPLPSRMALPARSIAWTSVPTKTSTPTSFSRSRLAIVRGDGSPGCSITSFESGGRSYGR
jgi:hypothetical protein